MADLVSLTRPSLQILDKTQTGAFSISEYLVKSHIKRNCHNSRTSNDIGMKFVQVTKLYNGNATTSKNRR